MRSRDRVGLESRDRVGVGRDHRGNGDIHVLDEAIDGDVGVSLCYLGGAGPPCLRQVPKAAPAIDAVRKQFFRDTFGQCRVLLGFQGNSICSHRRQDHCSADEEAQSWRVALERGRPDASSSQQQRTHRNGARHQRPVVEGGRVEGAAAAGVSSHCSGGQEEEEGPAEGTGGGLLAVGGGTRGPAWLGTAQTRVKARVQTRGLVPGPRLGSC